MGSSSPSHVLRIHIALVSVVALCSMACGTSGLGGTDGSDAAESNGPPLIATPRLPIDASGTIDVSGGPFRIVEVPGLSMPEIARTPAGWLALSMRSLGYGKAPSGYESALYRSRDGVHWELLPFDPAPEDPSFQDIAYGAGRYVMVGSNRRMPVIWVSSDALHWTEQSQSTEYTTQWRRVVFAGGRFFALGGTLLGVSQDGARWTQVRVSTVQVEGVAHGNGRYVVVGSGPIQVSEDGLNFREVVLDCGLPGACITDPSGGVHPGVFHDVLFAQGRFYAGRLSSDDGLQWRADSSPEPLAHVEGWFFGGDTDVLRMWRGPEAWHEVHVIRPAKAAQTQLGRAETSIGVLPREMPAPASVEVAFEDGLDCTTATCLPIGRHLLLAPPPGTAALPDRVPRGAEGAPLLSDTCPLSTQIACDDYATRRGCRCNPEAPARPDSCEDVSNFACAGRFTPRAGEWELTEVGDAGCSCDAIDPNQPASFGADCQADATRCTAPLRCLAVDPVESFGPPGPIPMICTAPCTADSDCPSWQATGYCAGPVTLRCSSGSCQPRECP